MAVKRSGKKEDNDENEDINVLIESHFKEMRKFTDSSSLKNSDYTKIKDWLSTGDYGVNSIISGDIKKGVPSGRITVFYGESGSGKSYLTANCIIDALNNKGYHRCLYFDSEGGALFDMLEKKGVNPDKIEPIIVKSIEDAQVKIIKALAKMEELQKIYPKFKFICVLDSLGMLVTDKVVTDAMDKDKVAGDMGAAAKARNSLIRSLVQPVLKTQCPFIIINHAYDNPASLFASKIKEQAGGKGVKFAAHITIQMDKRFEKEGTGEDGAFYKTAVLKAFCTKNRVSKPFHESELFLDYNSGPLKWFGLIEKAKQFGFITSPKKGYFIVPSFDPEKSFRLAQVAKSDKIWDTFIDKLNECINKEMSYDITSEISDDALDGLDEDED